MHPSTFAYLKPTEAQLADMEAMRTAAKNYAEAIEQLVPSGPDKTYIQRQLRSLAMWCNVAITRLPDGTPRDFHADEHPVEDSVGQA